MRLLITSLIALLLLYAAAVLLVHIVMFVLGFRLFLGARLPSDASNIRLLPPDEEADPEDLEFLLQCHEEGQQLGLTSLGDFELLDGGVRTVLSCWEIPGTDLAVSYGKHQLPQNAKYPSRLTKEAHNRSSDDRSIGVTTNEMALPNAEAEQPPGSILIARPADTSTTELIGIAWAVATIHDISLTQVEHETDYLTEVRRQRTDSLEQSIQSKAMKQDNSGDTRFSLRACFGYSLSGLPVISKTRSYFYMKKCNRIYAAAEHLLPADPIGQWIIPAIQDRVRTGSTAPLTQP